MSGNTVFCTGENVNIEAVYFESRQVRSPNIYFLKSLKPLESD